MPKYLYKVIFQDGSPDFFGGSNIHNSKWLEIPDRSISRLEYFICEGEGIILDGFESYLCMVEAESNVSGKTGNCPVCKSKGKISKRIDRYTDSTERCELIARCTKCDWVGKINELIHKCSHNGDKYIYIMGLKDNKVTSYRVALNGRDGEDKYQTGDITKRILSDGKEYRGRSTNKNLWKRGIK